MICYFYGSNEFSVLIKWVSTNFLRASTLVWSDMLSHAFTRNLGSTQQTTYTMSSPVSRLVDLYKQKWTSAMIWHHVNRSIYQALLMMVHRALIIGIHTHPNNGRCFIFCFCRAEHSIQFPSRGCVGINYYDSTTTMDRSIITPAKLLNHSMEGHGLIHPPVW
jgi:hypothetical protein